MSRWWQWSNDDVAEAPIDPDAAEIALRGDATAEPWEPPRVAVGERLDRDGMTYTEIGAELGISRQAAEQTARKACKKLRKTLGENFR